jgi:glutamate formiminotransferase/glutamate formiminotransferase/formiminotetrahydrofolate cyclodeaminase
MMVECVPNFSEGRKSETVARLVQAIESVRPAVVLDTHMDADHNRSVITFASPPDTVVEAAFRAVEAATDLIDLRKHTGQHPRIGATDVLPFVPVSGTTMQDCVTIAHQAGERIARELAIPVYFYERAALRPDRVNLENVRRHGFEELREQISVVAERSPDVGPSHIHETAGAIAVGARPFLIAFNVNLRSEDVSVARKIARAVRGRDGGLPFVKALGIELKSRRLVQVSMNLVDYESTGIQQAYEAVCQQAQSLGVEIAGAEIVGLVPQAALDRHAPYYGALEHFSEDAVLEARLRSR